MSPDSFLAKGDFVYRSENPPVYNRSEGPYLYDNNGGKYFDAEAANGTALLGYDSTLLDQIVSKVRDMPSLPSFSESELRLRVAEKLGRMMMNATGEKGRVAFELGGAQGMELALKIAKLNTGKSQFAVFEGAYHGRSGYTSQLSASHRYRSILGDWRIPVTRLPFPEYREGEFPASFEEWKQWYLSQVDRLLSNEIGGMANTKGEQDIAAFIMEPVLNVSGMMKPDKELIEEIVRKFKNRGALVIIDEIFTGFYRTGKPFGFQHYDIDPDMVVMSKGLTNGLVPMSCIWGKDPLLDTDHFPPGTHSATFINNPMGLATADTILDRYQEWTTIEEDIHVLQTALHESIQRICEQSDIAKNGYALGGLGRIVLCEPVASTVRSNALNIQQKAKTSAHELMCSDCNGILLASTGMTPDVINIHPPIKLQQKQIQEMQELLEYTLMRK